jgi:hypothetical protein
VWKKDEKLQRLEEIPNAAPIEWKLYHDTWIQSLNEAVECIEQLPLSDSEKKKLISHFENDEDVLKMDNEMKYYYCQVVENLLENKAPFSFQNEWMTECNIKMEYWQIADFVNIHRYREITENFFNFAQRIRTEILERYQLLTKHEKNIKNGYLIFQQDLTSVSIGIHGEQRVGGYLKDYDGQIIVIPNLRIEVEGESIENDFVVVSPYGVHVLEVKNLGSGGSYSLHIEKDGRWSKHYGDRIEPMNSVLAQNERHILYLEKYLNGKLKRSLDNYLRVQGIIVIANDKVDVTNETDDVIIRYNKVMNEIKKNPVVMKEAEMKEIAGLLQEAALPPLEYEFDNAFWHAFLSSKVFKEQYQRWWNSIQPLLQLTEDYLADR